jgi:hypothetical protein
MSKNSGKSKKHMASTPSKSAAAQVTWLGVKVAWWLAKKTGGVAVKWVVAGTKWTINLIRWPQPYVEIQDTSHNWLKVLQAIASWGMSHWYINAADYKNAKTLSEFARLIHTKILPWTASGYIALRFMAQNDTNKFWTDCLTSHGIPYAIT